MAEQSIDQETDYVEYNELFNEYWSIFFPIWIIKSIITFGGKYRGTSFRIIYWFILIVLSSPILLPIWSVINNLFICYRDYLCLLTALKNLYALAGVIAMLCAARFGYNSSRSNTFCPDCYYDVTKYIDAIEDDEEKRFNNKCCKSIFSYIANMLWNLFYTWIFLIFTSCYLTFIIPILNPNLTHPYDTIDWIIIMADFALITIRIYHNQFYLIICDRLCKKIKCQLNPIVCKMESLVKKSAKRTVSHESKVEDENEVCHSLDVECCDHESNDGIIDIKLSHSEECDETALVRIERHLSSQECQQKPDHYNLTQMIMRCIYLRSVISNIDKKICWFTFFGAIEFVMCIPLPFIQLLYTLKSGQITPYLAIIYYSPWLVFRFLFFFYSIFKTFKIANTYKFYVRQYKIIFSSRLLCTECPLLKKEFTYANEKIFKKTPSLSLGGLIPMGSPPVCTIIIAIKMLLSLGILPVVLKNIYDYLLPSSVKGYYFTHCENLTLI